MLAAERDLTRGLEYEVWPMAGKVFVQERNDSFCVIVFSRFIQPDAASTIQKLVLGPLASRRLRPEWFRSLSSAMTMTSWLT